MILNGCSLISGSACRKHKSFKSNSYHSASSSIPHLPVYASSSGSRSSWGPCQQLKFCSSKGSSLLHLSSASSSFLSGDQCSSLHAITQLPRGRRPLMAPRATKDVPFTFRYPPMTKKPRFWWRILASIPYLLPLHSAWMSAETAYNVHAFLEDYEFMTYPFLEVIGQLPRWSILVYFLLSYLFIVRRKEWPHFLRFHVVLGLLLEISLQVVGMSRKWMPNVLYWGKIGAHFWTAAAFGFLFTAIVCIQCALAGMYADVPILAPAAYIQIPYD